MTRFLRDHVGNESDLKKYLQGVQCLRPLTAAEREQLAAHEEAQVKRARKATKKWRGSKPLGSSSPPSPTPSEPTP